MITIGIAVLAGGLYFLGKFSWAFWIIVFAILNGGFAAVRATIDPDWYNRGRVQAGLEPVDGLSELYLHKGILIAALVLVAWHVGDKAGYF